MSRLQERIQRELAIFEQRLHAHLDSCPQCTEGLCSQARDMIDGVEQIKVNRFERPDVFMDLGVEAMVDLDVKAKGQR